MTASEQAAIWQMETKNELRPIAQYVPLAVAKVIKKIHIYVYNIYIKTTVMTKTTNEAHLRAPCILNRTTLRF